MPYAVHLDETLARLYPLLLDALWKSPDPDEALNQFERLLAGFGSNDWSRLHEMYAEDAVVQMPFALPVVARATPNSAVEAGEVDWKNPPGALPVFAVT